MGKIGISKDGFIRKPGIEGSVEWAHHRLAIGCQVIHNLVSLLDGYHAMRRLLKSVWTDYAESHLWCGMDDAHYSGFERENIYRYADEMRKFGIEVDPDAMLAESLENYMKRNNVR